MDIGQIFDELLTQSEAGMTTRHAREEHALRLHSLRAYATTVAWFILGCTGSGAGIAYVVRPGIAVGLLCLGSFLGFSLLLFLFSGRPRSRATAHEELCENEVRCTCGLSIHLEVGVFPVWVHRDGLSLHLLPFFPFARSEGMMWAGPA
jgi:hypothetical protein